MELLSNVWCEMPSIFLGRNVIRSPWLVRWVVRHKMSKYTSDLWSVLLRKSFPMDTKTNHVLFWKSAILLHTFCTIDKKYC